MGCLKSWARWRLAIYHGLQINTNHQGHEATEGCADQVPKFSACQLPEACELLVKVPVTWQTSQSSENFPFVIVEVPVCWHHTAPVDPGTLMSPFMTTSDPP